MKVNLFASEKEFPELVNPVQMACDTKGRLWVAVWPTYPHWKPKEPMNDKLLILEDTDGDGKADKCTVFADDLHNPTGFEFWNGGVLVAQAPDLLFLKDTDGDDKADVRDTRPQRPRLGRHAPHGQQLRARPGRGALLPGRHVPPHAGRDALRPAGALRQRRRLPLRAADAEVRGLRHLSASPTRTATSSTAGARTSSSTAPAPTRTTPPSSPATLDYPAQAPPARRRSISSGRGPAPASRSCPAGTSRDEMQGNLLVANVIGFQGILQYKIDDEGASFGGDRARADPLVDRPELPPVGPRDRPRRRDLLHSTGTTRSSATCSTTSATPAATASTAASTASPTKAGRCSKPAKIAGEPIEKLLDLLKEPEDRVRYRARIELSGRDDRRGHRRGAEVDRRPRHEGRRTTSTTCSKACGCISSHNVVNVDLLKRVLGSPDFRARAAATRVLCYWRDRVSGRAGPAQEAGGRRAPARPARSGPRGQLLHRPGGGRGRR